MNHDTLKDQKDAMLMIMTTSFEILVKKERKGAIIHQQSTIILMKFAIK